MLCNKYKHSLKREMLESLICLCGNHTHIPLLSLGGGSLGCRNDASSRLLRSLPCPSIDPTLPPAPMRTPVLFAPSSPLSLLCQQPSLQPLLFQGPQNLPGGKQATDPPEGLGMIFLITPGASGAKGSRPDLQVPLSLSPAFIVTFPGEGAKPCGALQNTERERRERAEGPLLNHGFLPAGSAPPPRAGPGGGGATGREREEQALTDLELCAT